MAIGFGYLKGPGGIGSTRAFRFVEADVALSDNDALFKDWDYRSFVRDLERALRCQEKGSKGAWAQKAARIDEEYPAIHWMTGEPWELFPDWTALYWFLRGYMERHHNP